jgi:hypothetical protein
MTPLLLALSLPAAAPLPCHPLTPAGVCGHWNIRWSGTPGWANLSPSGHWSCVLVAGDGSGSLYVGTWRVDGGVLLVREHLADDGPDDGWLEYAFLPDERSCRGFETYSGVTLRLVSPVRPRRVPPPGRRP